MADKIKYLKIISDIISKYDLGQILSLNSLKSDKLEVFLAGLPKNGKTTFLNAMLGLPRNELYESTKKATKCIFKISYGEKYCYKRNNDEIKPLPENLEARKELIIYLNNTDNYVELFLPAAILKKINIYDIPGLFSGDKTDNNFVHIIKSSDLILFLKNSDDMCSPDEFNLINMGLQNGANYMVLFSFGDLLDKAIKNNPAEYLKYFTNKISEYPGTPEYFSISSEDYYRGNAKGNISDVVNYIRDNSGKIKSASLNKKIVLSAREYTEMLENRLREARNIIDGEKDKLNDLYKIKFSREKLNKDDELSDFIMSLNDYCDQLSVEIKKILYSKDKSDDDLQNTWNKYLEFSNMLAQKKIKKEFKADIPELPIYDDIILSNYDLEYLLNQIKVFTNNKDNKSKETESLMKTFREQLEQSKDSDKKSNEKDKNEGKTGNVLDKIVEILKNADYNELYDEILKYIKYIKAVNLFLEKGQSVYTTFNEMLIELFKKEIDEEFQDTEQHMAEDILNLENKLKVEFITDDLENDIKRLKEYINEP